MAPGYSGCNLCLRAIAPTDPRINCLECHEYDLCANCAIGAEEFPGGHLATHRICVFRMSGGGAQAPVLSLSTIVYRIPGVVQVAAVEPISPPLTAHESSDSFLPPQKPVPPADVVQPPQVVQRVSPPQSPAPSTYTPTPPPPPVVQSPSLVRVSSPQSPAPLPPVLPARQSMIISSPPPRRNMIISSLPPSAYIRTPAAALAALAQTAVEKTPENNIPIKTEVPAILRPAAQPSTSQGGVSAYTMPPRDEPPPNTPRTTSVAPAAPPGTPPPPPNGWGPFFNADMSPTPVFTELMDAIFTYLDTRNTGNLTPEVYSRFLINQGYVGKQNIWHSNLVASMGKTKEECADAALKRAFDLFNIQYILRPRAREPTSPPADMKRQLQSFGASFARALTPAAPAAGTMPLLTRAGFLSITTVEVLCDPSRHHTGLARVVQMYDLGAPVRAWGALPRGVLPDEPDTRMLARVARVQATSREKQPDQVRASAASAAGGLLLAAAYAQNAVNKISGKDVVNAINVAGEVAYIANSVNS
ncbi:hypothetical protein B0H12DRAFT_1219159 [Mycena haematopus]|nr:hypothetical protein B0H12DRAFT_1219159 [Mycena haematopus]